MVRLVERERPVLAFSLDGAAAAAIRGWSLVEMNRMKAVTRIGMGRCQGRICGLAAEELLAAETGRGLAEVGRLRGQPPVKPMPIPWMGEP
jgi:hypothetical protein